MNRMFPRLLLTAAIDRLADLTSELMLAAHAALHSVEKKSHSGAVQMELLRLAGTTLERGADADSAMAHFKAEELQRLDLERKRLAPRIQQIDSVARENCRTAAGYASAAQVLTEQVQRIVSKQQDAVLRQGSLYSDAQEATGGTESALEQLDAINDRLKALARKQS